MYATKNGAILQQNKWNGKLLSVKIHLIDSKVLKFRCEGKGEMKKIDIHCHVVAFPEYSTKRLDGHKYLSAEEQVQIHEKLNVDKGILLPITTVEAHWATISNEAAQYVANKYPDRFVWFCSVDPRQGRNSAQSDLGYIISQYKEMGARGVGELGMQMNADDPMLQNLFGYCEALDMPVLIHLAPQYGGTYGIVDGPGLPGIEKMLKKHPDLKLIGHSAAFWWEISKGNDVDTRNGYPKGKVEEGRLPELMREYGNLYCDLSAGSGSNAMMRDREYAAKFLTEFSDRIFYGTDVCSTQSTFQYDFDKFLTGLVSDKIISTETYEKIIRKNAEGLLNI